MPAASEGSETLPLPAGSSARREAKASTMPVLQHRYQLVRIVGYGSYGLVFRGWDLARDVAVAVKILKSGCYGDAFIEAQWRREQEFAATLDIDAAPRGIAWGDEKVRGARVSYLVTELIEGETWREWREALECSPDRKRMASLAGAAVEGLLKLEALGIVHRDIKPTNLMLISGDGVKIMDFGLYRHVDDPPSGRPDRVVGTPHYVAPELVLGEDGEGPCDVYSLGCALYFVVRGRVPYQREGLADIFEAHKSAPLPAFDGALPDGAEFEAMVRRMVAKDPATRPDLHELREAFAELAA
jgi:eukaryotic-like serine/threonine-protein kinase